MEASAAVEQTRKGQSNPFVNGLLEDAQTLDDEKKGVYERITANRDTLRMVAKTGFLSKAQSDAIEEFYPTRVVNRKPKDSPAA